MKVINLLPKIRKQELAYIAMLRGFWVIVLLSLASFALVFLAQIGARLYLGLKADALQRQILVLQEQVNKKENAEIKAKIKAANDLVSDFKNLSDSAPKWSKVIKAFVSVPPEGVKINSFAIDPAKKSITISGLSPTRDLAIELHDRIQADSKDFYGIDYPFEIVAKATDISFSFTFNIKDELLK